MKNKIPAKSAAKPRVKRQGYGLLVSAISAINTQMVGSVATAANQALVLRNWTVGAYIVQFEQRGADRAKYGARLLERLAEDLKGRGIKGLDERTLRACRTFFGCYPQIRGPLAPELEKSAVLRVRGLRDPQSATGAGAQSGTLPTPLESERLARISWAHFLELIHIDDPWKRAFYENEIIDGHWSKRQLQRQIGSLLYERTGLSTNRKAVIERVRKHRPRQEIYEVMRDPYILEFTGLAERSEYSEGDLETALLDHVQRFVLELGRGFCFEARQFRMTEGRKHHRVDLVFYHRLLRCHVLIDLKIRAFRPADAGQMNFYVNWFKANMQADGYNPPIGILLCSDKDGAEVEFATAGMDQKLFVSRYLTALPTVAQLKTLLERDYAGMKALIRKD